MQRCSRCVTPASYPGTSLNKEGVCSHCTCHEAKYSNWGASGEERETALSGLIEDAKARKRPYDVLVPLSGGKDSTYVLYLATKKYGCRTLCYNFDNGFQSDIAKKNIASAIAASGATLVTVKPDEARMMELYRHFLRNTGLFCPVCMRGIYAGLFATARKYDIPLVLKGTSKRTEEAVVPEIFQDGTLSFFRNVLKKHPFRGDVGMFRGDRSIREKLGRGLHILSGGKLRMGTLDIQVPEYLDWNYETIYRTIREEMGWQALPDRDEHVDCLADPAAHYLRQIRCRDLTPGTLRYSAEIRTGERTRDEALKLVEDEARDGIDRRHVQYLLDKLQMNWDDLAFSMKEPRRHMEFQKEDLGMRLFQKLRTTVASMG